MLVLIDNYDSFTYNLVQVMAGQGAELKVFRNDEIDVSAIEALAPRALIVSPGPCTPNEAGVSVAAIRHFAGRLPILGVCLGHQSIAAAFGGVVSNAQCIMHGKTSLVHHDASLLYKGLKNPFPAGRYHSLAVMRDTLPACLAVTAWTDDGEIMGMRHRELEVYGVQFHPESVLTPSGKRLLRNFLSMAGEV
jgi:anthranilate synthase component II